MANESKSFSVPGTTTTNIWNNTSSPWPGSVSTVVSDWAQGSWSRNSIATPGYMAKRLAGDLPENVFGFSETEMTALIGRTFETIKSTPTKRTYSLVKGRTGPLWSHTTPWTSAQLAAVRLNQSNLCAARLAKKVIDSDIDLSVAAGEYRETSRMFKDLAQRLVKAARALKHGDVGGVATALSVKGSKDWANAWLLANYGIKPLVNDIFGGAKALEKGLLKETYHVESTRVVYEDSKTTVTGTLLSGLWTVTWNLRIETSMRVKYTTTNATLATLASLGLTNPLVLIWELKKLSFVIDWAIGIGAWLNQLGASAGRTFNQGSTTVFTRITGHASYTRFGETASIRYDNFGTQKYSIVTCNRTALTSFPVAWLPAIKDPTSIANLTTSAALLRQSKR